MRWRSTRWRFVDRTPQIFQEGFICLVVGQGQMPLVADQIKESNGEPLPEQGQGAWAGQGCGICELGLQLCAEDLLVAQLHQPDGFLPALVGGEKVETRLKGPWRQGLIRFHLLCPVDEGLSRFDDQGAAVDDLHGDGGDPSWKRRHDSQCGPTSVCVLRQPLSAKEFLGTDTGKPSCLPAAPIRFSC